MTAEEAVPFNGKLKSTRPLDSYEKKGLKSWKRVLEIEKGQLTRSNYPSIWHDMNQPSLSITHNSSIVRASSLSILHSSLREHTSSLFILHSSLFILHYSFFIIHCYEVHHPQHARQPALRRYTAADREGRSQWTRPPILAWSPASACARR